LPHCGGACKSAFDALNGPRYACRAVIPAAVVVADGLLAARERSPQQQAEAAGTMHLHTDGLIDTSGGDGLAYFFLHRLAALVERQDRATTPETRAALAHAAFSTYLDCVDLGLMEEASQILAREPLGQLLIHEGTEA
jgi:hypothetical protein